LEASSIIVRLYHLLLYCTSPQRPRKRNECLTLLAANFRDSPVDLLSVSEEFDEWTRNDDSSCRPAWHAVNAASSLPRSAPAGLVELFVHHQPLHTCFNDNGWSALHCLASAGRAKVSDGCDDSCQQHHEEDACVQKLQLLLSVSPSLSRVPDCLQRLPIHVAAASGFPANGLRVLLESWPCSLLRRDGKDHLFPALVAAASQDTSLDSVFLLLLACPHVLSRNGGTQ
jgi:hypothetical protein